MNIHIHSTHTQQQIPSTRLEAHTNKRRERGRQKWQFEDSQSQTVYKMVMKSLKLSSVQDKSQIVLKPSGLDYNDHAHKILRTARFHQLGSQLEPTVSLPGIYRSAQTQEGSQIYQRERCGNTFSALTDLIWGPSLYSVVHATPLSKFPLRDQ